jgi:2-polyprenyl-6-methoxyphenol hydroxylase-like FAD-dependent oxidoreductase
VIMGDAAHVVHPMAGQGVNLGIGDAKDLVLCIEKALHTGTDIGGIALLQQWERKRKLENAIMMGGIDMLHKVFSINNGPFTWLRSVGLDVFNAVSPLKRLSMERAMGVSKST